MESNSFPMCIHVSQAVVDRYPARDQFVSLGERQIKGKGIMVTFLYKVSHSSIWTRLIGCHAFVQQMQ